MQTTRNSHKDFQFKIKHFSGSKLLKPKVQNEVQYLERNKILPFMATNGSRVPITVICHILTWEFYNLARYVWNGIAHLWKPTVKLSIRLHCYRTLQDLCCELGRTSTVTLFTQVQPIKSQEP